MRKRILAICILFALSIGLVPQTYAASDEKGLNIEYDCGDRTFFHSDYIWDVKDSYGNNVAVNENGNTITLKRCEERYNADRADNGIYMKKTETDECFVDVYGTMYEDDIYPYYLVRGKVTAKTVSKEVNLCFLRSKTGVWADNVAILRLLADGNVALANGESIGTWRADEELSYAVNIDVDDCEADVYIDGAFVKTVALSENAVNIDRVRFGINTSTTGDEVMFESVEITGMRKPYTGDENNYTSIFHSDEAIENWLSDKVAYHEYSGAVFENGVKSYPSVMPDKSKYKYVFEDGEGLVILSNNEIGLDKSKEVPEYKQTGSVSYPYTDIKTLNWYMAFERPSAATMKSDFEETNASHPRVMATASDFEYIRANRESDSYLKAVCDSAIDAADGILSLDALGYQLPDKQRLLGTSRKMLERMEYLGFAYQITKDKKYVECAWENLSSVISYPDWNPSHMIDVGEMNAAVAIGFDWMYDGFSSEQRTAIYEGARKLGLEVTRLAYYGRIPDWTQWAQASGAFTKWKSNFNAVINGGALAGAMAFAEYDEDFCFDIAEKAVRSLEFTMIGFAPDGAWAEGLHYLDYTLSYLSKGVGSMMKTLGTDYGLMSAAGVDKTAQWFVSMRSDEGQNNFHDFDMSEPYLSCEYLPWLASALDDDSLCAVRREKSKARGEYTVYDAIWYQKDASADSLPLYVTAKGLETVSARSSYTDDDAMYFSAHGGLVYCYHSHADAGTFVYDVNGERWAADLGAEDYNVQRDGGLLYYGSYRRRAEAHNVVVINPNTSDSDGGQNDGGFAELVQKVSSDAATYSEYDMTSVYEDYVDSYSRGFYTDNASRSIVVEDTLDLKESSEVYWFMTTPATVEWTDGSNSETDSDGNEWVNAKKFCLTQNGKKLYGTIDVRGAAYKCAVTKCEPILGAPTLPKQNTNSGYRRIAIKATGDDALKIRVTLSPDSDFSLKPDKTVGFDNEIASGETVMNMIYSEGVNIAGWSTAFPRTNSGYTLAYYGQGYGKFGKTAKDGSVHLFRTSQTSVSDATQYIQYQEEGYNGTVTQNTASKLNEGEFSEIELYMAWSEGTKDYRTIAASLNNNDGEGNGKYGGWEGAILQVDPNGKVLVFGSDIGVTLDSEKWHKFNLVLHAGDKDAADTDGKNWYKLYIDNRLVKDKTVFEVKSRSKVLNKFTGFQGYELTLRTVANNTVTDGVWFDDFTVKNNLKTEPSLQATSVTTEGAAKKYLGNGFSGYADDRVSIENLKFADNVKVDYVTESGEAAADLKAEKTYVRVNDNGEKLYGVIRNKSEKVFEKTDFSSDAVGGASVYTVSSVSGKAGKAASDTAMCLSCDNTSGSSDAWPSIQIRNKEHMNSKIDPTKPFTAEVSILADGDFEQTNIQLGNDGAKLVAYLKSDGTVRDSSHETVAKYAKGEWIRIGISVYPAANKLELRVNGADCGEYDFANASAFTRLRYEQKISKGNKASLCLDDIVVYQGSRPERSGISLKVLSDDFALSNGAIYLKGGAVDAIEFYSGIYIDGCLDSMIYKDGKLENAVLDYSSRENPTVSDKNVLVVNNKDEATFGYFDICEGEPK